MTTIIQQIQEEFDRLKIDIEKMIENKIVTSKQVRTNTLADISPILGLIQSFEFRTPGNPNSPTYSGIQITENGIATFKNGAQTGSIQNDGDVLFGSNISAAASTGFLIFSQDQTYNGESMGAGDIIIGDNSSGKPNILWDKSQGYLYFRVGTSVSSFLSNSGFSQVGAKMNIDAPGQSIPSGTTTVMSFDEEEYDDSTFIDLGTDDTKITIPTGQGGVYSIGANLGISSNSGGYRSAMFYINGVGAHASVVAAVSGAATTINFSEDQLLNAGDYIQLKINQNSGSSLNHWGNIYVRKIR